MAFKTLVFEKQQRPEEMEMHNKLHQVVLQTQQHSKISLTLCQDSMYLRQSIREMKISLKCGSSLSVRDLNFALQFSSFVLFSLSFLLLKSFIQV
jgi:hypothetical protein